MAEGKEDAARIDERRGIASVPRPDGPLIWFHAASVGESVALLELIRELLDARPDLTILVTTGTVTSAGRHGGPAAGAGPCTSMCRWTRGVFVRRFLDHWRPDLAVWTESELWPALVCETHARGVPMILLNARMSKASHDRWRFLHGMARSLLRRFEPCDGAGRPDRDLPAPPRHAARPDGGHGHPEGGAAALPVNDSDLAVTRREIGGRPVWVAASTHPGEEEKVLEAHRIALRTNPRLLLILVPRHPDRGDEIAGLLEQSGCVFTRRSLGEGPERETAVYLADTNGRVGPVVIVSPRSASSAGHGCRSAGTIRSSRQHWVPRSCTGLMSPIFVDIYQRLTEARAARLVSAPQTLAEAVDDLLSPDRAAAMAHAAWEVVSSGADVGRAGENGPSRQAGRRVMRPPAFWHLEPGLRAALLSPLGAVYAAGTRRRLAEGARARSGCAGDLRGQPERGRHGQDDPR